MASYPQILKPLYNIFNPTRPLEVGDPGYVDCQKVRGDVNLVEELSQEIILADEYTCQLYTGHRGGGKSTELKRLVHYLEEQGYQVVYFDVLEDVDPEDVSYTDILIACTRRLLTALKGNTRSIKAWFEDRAESLKQLAMTSIEKGDSAIGFFSQLTTNLKAVPTLRYKIRQEVEPHTPKLLEVLNEFIASAQPDQADRLVLIVDSLERIVPVINSTSERVNYDEIFLDRSEQLKGLKCHVIYTIPISMQYSGSASQLQNCYSSRVKVLPMVKMRKRGSREPYLPGIAAFKELITKRLQQVLPQKTLLDLFADEEIVTELCLASGGNARELVHLLRDTLKFARGLPLSAQTVQRAIAELREVYRRMIFEDHWQMLAEVYVNQEMPNRDEYRKLLYDRCLLEYRQLDEATQNISSWHDVHPLIVATEKFQAVLKSIS